MKVYALIPVFNRLEHTKRVVECLKSQKQVDISILIVNDGSTDGTKEYLSENADIIALNGDGNLWWAGAMDIALRHVHKIMNKDDYFLFINNDTVFDNQFIQTLVNVSLENDHAVVGCTIRETGEENKLIDIGPRSDLNRFAIWDFNSYYRERNITCTWDIQSQKNPKIIIKVDFVSGRGTLYPASVLDKIGYLRPMFLPHYLADYEYSYRAYLAGYQLLIAIGATVYSTEEFGNQKKIESPWKRLFGKGSPENILHKIFFFSVVGTPQQRYTVLLRMPWECFIKPYLRQIKEIRAIIINKLVFCIKIIIGPNMVKFIKKRILNRKV